MKKNIIISISVLMVMFILLTACKKTTTDIYSTDKTNTTNEVEATVTTEAAVTEKVEEPVVNTTPKTYYTDGGVWYEIFVRSFADSNGDRIGDLKGIIAKLDYLNDGNPDTTTDLGVEGIWLMPINTSPSYHGYDVTDYYNVNPEYGTNEDLQLLLDEAHKRGIKVIMDLVVNHSSAQHPWFLEAKADANSKYRDYYRFVADGTEGYDFNLNVWGHKVWNKVGDSNYYAIFWDQMPDMNFDNQVVRDEFKNVAKFWLDLGIDGFRMDAAMHIFGQGETVKGTNTAEATDNWWKEFDLYCRSVKPDYYLVGEVWDDAIKRAKFSDSFDTTFNFDMAENGIMTLVNGKSDLNSKNNKFVTDLMDQYTRLEADNPNFIDAPFLSNHDGQRSAEILKSDLASMKLAANIYMTIKGNPFIYYGEEIGMLGNKPDERIREPLLWGEADTTQTKWEAVMDNKDVTPIQIQDRVPDSLLNHYRQLINMRNKSDAITNGDFVPVETTSNKLIAYGRNSQSQSVIIVHNLDVNPQKMETSQLFTSETTVLYSSNTFEYANEQEIEIPAQTTVIFEVK